MTHSDRPIGQLERRRAPRYDGESKGVLVWFAPPQDESDWGPELEAELLDMSEVGIAFCLPNVEDAKVEKGTSCRLELGRDPERRIRFEGPIVRRIDGDRVAFALEIHHVHPLSDELAL